MKNKKQVALTAYFKNKWNLVLLHKNVLIYWRKRNIKIAIKNKYKNKNKKNIISIVCSKISKMSLRRIKRRLREASFKEMHLSIISFSVWDHKFIRFIAIRRKLNYIEWSEIASLGAAIDDKVASNISKRLNLMPFLINHLWILSWISILSSASLWPWMILNLRKNHSFKYP
jgi:hypothetical protein